MRIVAEYSFNNGATSIAKRWQKELDEICEAIAAVDAGKCRTKISREKTMPGKRLNDPKALNKEFKVAFGALDWASCKVKCDYPQQYYRPDFKDRANSARSF